MDKQQQPEYQFFSDDPPPKPSGMRWVHLIGYLHSPIRSQIVSVPEYHLTDTLIDPRNVPIELKAKFGHSAHNVRSRDEVPQLILATLMAPPFAERLLATQLASSAQNPNSPAIRAVEIA